MHIFKPVFKILFHRLLRPCCKNTLLLFVQSHTQLFLNFLTSFPIKRLTFTPIKTDACSPAPITTLINRTLTMPTSCHCDPSHSKLKAKTTLPLKLQIAKPFTLEHRQV